MEEETEDDFELNPWTARGKFTNEKYQQLIDQFGVSPIDVEMLRRFEEVTGHKPHRMMRRGLFFAHRELDKVLDDLEAGKQIYLYTGRGPSSDSLHLGHILPIEFTVWLQKALNAVVVFQMSDDEKYWVKDLTFEEVYRLGRENAKDIIAMGFDPEKTYVFSNRDVSVQRPYHKIFCDILKDVRLKDIQAIFGITGTDTLGKVIWPAYQAVPAFSAAFPGIFGSSSDGKTPNVRCLVLYAIDQDPYFRYARDFAEKRGFYKPTAMMCQFLPALEGDAKMSSTQSTNGPSKTIFMDDTPKGIKNKINRYAFSGGQATVEEHREKGGNPDVDISYQWLKYFMEDDEELLRIEREYREGKMLTGELKKITIGVVTSIVNNHKEKRATVTDDMVDEFYRVDNVKF